MTLKVGQKLWAICDHFYQNRKCLTKYKEYAINAVSSGGGIIVLDDTMEAHGFIYKNIGKFFTTEPPKTKRYFIVFFTADEHTGHVEITTNGEFVNQKEAMKEILEFIDEKGCAITNIIELSKTDYEAWNR